MDLVHIIDGLIALIVMGGGWFLGSQSREVKWLGILLNKNREDNDKRDDVAVAIHRLEETEVRIIEKIKSKKERNTRREIYKNKIYSALSTPISYLFTSIIMKTW